MAQRRHCTDAIGTLFRLQRGNGSQTVSLKLSDTDTIAVFFDEIQPLRFRTGICCRYACKFSAVETKPCVGIVRFDGLCARFRQSFARDAASNQAGVGLVARKIALARDVCTLCACHAAKARTFAYERVKRIKDRSNQNIALAAEGNLTQHERRHAV